MTYDHSLMVNRKISKQDDRIQSLKNTKQINKKIAARIAVCTPLWKVQTMLFQARENLLSSSFVMRKKIRITDMMLLI